MKDCCQTGDSEPEKEMKKIFRWVIYVVVFAIVVFVIWQDLNK